MASAASLNHDTSNQLHYSNLAKRARTVYVSTLWNGRYLDYDSSNAPHSCSIMADMLAGQWYARACALPPVVTPRMALSCFRSIYSQNVVAFGAGRFKGAVNGMKPPTYKDDSHTRNTSNHNRNHNRNNRTSNSNSGYSGYSDYFGYCGSGPANDSDGDDGDGEGGGRGDGGGNGDGNGDVSGVCLTGNGPGLGHGSISVPIDVVLADLRVSQAGQVDACCMQR
jgi:hypothetical protein